MSYYRGGGGYGDGGWGGGGYSRNFGGYGGGYKGDQFGGGRDRRSGGGGGGGGWGGGGRDRRSGGGGGGWGGGGRDRRSGGGGGGGRRDRDGGFKRNGDRRSGGGGPPSKFARQSDDNWDDAHQMMQSKFMVTKPDNFEEEWMFLVCPPGKRRFLVAALDTTQSYNNAGGPDLKFQSCLPSGSALMNEVHKEDDLTILDTVYSAEKKCFYIVDLVHWKHYPYTETDAEFRSFILNDKYAQLKTPEEVSRYNEYPLHLLPKYPCNNETIENALKSAEYKVEGLLFFKKDSLYLPGDSEHCLWLKLDKMEDLLDIDIPEGVNYAATNTRDEKRRAEQDEKEKIKKEREANIERQAEGGQEEEKDDQAEDKGDSQGGEADEGYYAPAPQGEGEGGE